MNGVRSTFMRRGYLLTALSALLLLAASPGTASAQNVSFSASSGEVREGAPSAGNPAFRVTISRTPAPSQGDDPVGNVSLVATPAIADFTAVDDWTFTTIPANAIAADGTITFSNNSVVVDIGKAVDTDWDNEKLTLTVNTDTALTPTARLVVTATDVNAQPTASFRPNVVRLTEGSQTTSPVTVSVGVPPGQTAPGALAGLTTGNLMVMVDPPDALDDDGFANNTTPGTDRGIITITPSAGADSTTNLLDPVAGRPGVYQLPAIGTISGTPVTLAIVAAQDMGGFNDSDVTVSFVSRSLMTASGEVANGGSLTINVISDEPVPTLSFSPTDVTINEGESVETVLIAEGSHGHEVGMVKLMVEGDADVSLMQGGKMLEEMDGHVYVNLGTSNSARLTAMSHESRELADGDMAYKAWKLVEGSTDGAMIGEGSWFRVDVVGSTAVPALPLIGQLLLALFLMAGGSRLYRRRRG